MSLKYSHRENQTVLTFLFSCRVIHLYLADFPLIIKECLSGQITLFIDRLLTL